MQKHKIPKSKVEKTLAKLASGDSPTVTCKEFGKSKVYFVAQEGLPTLSDEEIKAKSAEIMRLKTVCEEKKAAVEALRVELRKYSSRKTAEQLQEMIDALEREDEMLEKRLEENRNGGVVAIKKEDVEKVESEVKKNLGLWKKRKRSFDDIWGAVSENMDLNKKAVWEKIGVEIDGGVGGSLKDVEEALRKK
jgi:26S proteasome regulatory subunit (ATPase 3-interacting protein)